VLNTSPRVVLGLPAFARPDSLPRALESLLSQTYQDFALVVVDDAPHANVAEIVERYVHGQPQISYLANPTRLGMVGNWRKVFEQGRMRYPQSDYFAWVSDHDVWHARWLETLVSVLDREPEVVVAYTASLRTTRGRRVAGEERIRHRRESDVPRRASLEPRSRCWPAT
jgi:glycosyltransferase involved in cell wall biosynthesis